MFDTLNDRGLKASQVDNIKNRLFKESVKQLRDAENGWLAMTSVIESLVKVVQ